MAVAVETLAPTRRFLRKDLAAADKLGLAQVRYLVDSYYTVQDWRKAANSQTTALGKAEEPNDLVAWVGTDSGILEENIKRILASWAEAQPICQWAMSICGIGPVISSGLAAHIDISRAPTVGHIWRFAGLDPTSKWEKGQKRPWNASLKVLCWKIGESFVKVYNNPKDVYGKVYLERKTLEEQRNEAGLFADQAAAALVAKRYDKSTEAYKAYAAGRLPQGQLHARAKRYATKLFLSHWHHVAYELAYEKPPPKPYIIEHGGHTDFVAPPNWP